MTLLTRRVNAWFVIRSFGNSETERLWRRERVRSLDSRVLRTALRKLAILDAAGTLDDLRAPPGNRLEALKGNRRASTASGSTTSGGSASRGPRLVRRMSRSWTTTEEVTT